MGLWDVFDNAVKKPVTKAYQCTHDLGRVAVSKTVDGAVKISTVTKSVLTSSYAFGCDAVSKTDESVGNDGVVKQKVKEYLPGPEIREKIVQAFTHPATKEALDFVAQGRAQALYRIVGSLLLLSQIQSQNQNQNQNDEDDDEQNKYDHVIQQLKLLQAENEKMQKDLKELNELVMRLMSFINSSSLTVSEQKSEEAILEFMTQGS